MVNGRGANQRTRCSAELQAPNTELVAAKPGAGLPQLQSEQFGTITMGYGDLFVAGLLGGVYAACRRAQRAAAVITLAVAALFDLLFLVVDNLPATVPVAIALLIVEVALTRGRFRGPVSAYCDRSRQEDAIPPPTR